MLLELIVACGAFTALGLLEPTESQRRRFRLGASESPFALQLAELRRAGVVRRR